MSPSSTSGLGAMGRAAVLVAASVATVCGASALAGGDTTSLTAVQPSISVSIPPTPASSAVVLTKQQQELRDLYCQGPLLDAVQRARLFNDSKYFVDMPIKPNSSATQILTEFQQQVQPSLTSQPASVNETLLAFLDKHFNEPGSEIQKTVPSDFSESPAPPLIAGIKSEGYRKWALALHSLWKELGRSPDRAVRSSYLQPTPLAALGDDSNSTVIVVPGGRFRESYYWDSYWIVEGLIVSNMRETARRVVRNLLEYVAEFGFVPNGGRIYYLTRSQPPLLSDMVRLVAKKQSQQQQQQQQQQAGPKQTWDVDYLRSVVPLLEKEYSYWMTTHRVDVTVGGVTFKLNCYTGEQGEPRPESYREDVEIAQADFPGNTSRQTEFYNDIIAAAESGWDFSSRWFRDQKTLKTVATKDVLPVDLNSIMYRVESNLAEFYKALGNTTASARFTNAALIRAKAIEAVFWDQASSSWKDFILSSKTKSSVVSVANYYPLWAGAFDKRRDRLTQVVRSLRKSGLLQVAGIQTTTKETGAQWDAPNAWPPLQDILIEGLLKVNTPDSRVLAKELVSTWIKTSFAAWNQTGLMFEKYNATIVGGLGAGGEYVPQFGFGWTNGVVLKFLTEYENFLS